MIFLVLSSAEEMVVSITANDPSKCFPVLSKTIQLIQSLKRQIENEKGDLSKKRRGKIDVVLGNMFFFLNKRRKGGDRVFLHEKLKDLLPPNIWTMWIQSPWEGSV